MTDPTARLPGRHLTYRPALDGLRGLAVLAVVAFHFDALPGGYLGVDLFFVLSGFLITSLLLGEMSAGGSVDLKSFWSRHARRLLPALFLLIAAGALYAWLLATPAELSTIRHDGLAGLVYVSNWVQMGANSNYFDQFAAPSIFRHLWSLAIEEQFYVIWPLVASLIVWRARRPVRTLAIVSAVGTVASMGLAVALYDSAASLDRVYYGTDTRIGAILLGALCACLVRNADSRADAGHRVLPRWMPPAAGVALIALLGAWATLDGTSSLLWRGGLAACGIAAALVITVVGTSNDGLLAKVLSNPVLVRFGLISYGLYLWHWPVRVILTEDRTNLSGPTLFAVRFVVSVAVAFASYYLVEWPIRRGALSRPIRAGWPNVSTVGALLVPCALAGLIVATTAAPSGGDGTVPIAELLAQPDHALPTKDPLLPPGTKPRVLVLGDSVGHTIGSGVEKLATTNGFEANNSAVSGCALILETGQYLFDGKWYPDAPGCTKVLEVFDKAVASFKPNLVIIDYGRFWDPQREFANGKTLSPCEPEYDAWREATWTTILDHIKQSGLPIAVATAAYYHGTLPSPGADKQTDCMNKATLAAAKKAGVRVVDLGAWTCPNGTCVENIGGHLLRVDGLHYDEAMEPVAAKWLLDDVLDGWSTPAAAGSDTGN